MQSEGVIIKRNYCLFFTLSFISILLTACGTKTDNNQKEINVQDIKITQSDNVHYIKDSNGNSHSSDDVILILGFNGYQCTDTNIKYDDENDVYICTVELKKILHDIAD